MEISFTKDQEIGFILFQKINEPEICRNIIQLKNKVEQEEAYNFHYDLWENIASKYFAAAEINYRHISYLLNSENYTIQKDKVIDFYNETGISYQNRDLILSLINDYGWMSNKNFILPSEISKDVDDQIYSVMAQKIHDKNRFKY